MIDIEKFINGGDLRSIGLADELIPIINNQLEFDRLFNYLYSNDRLQRMRAVDAIEKITINKREYLAKYTNELIEMAEKAKDKELKWHLALLVSRLSLNNNELNAVWNRLTDWAKDKKESKIVRVNSIQGLNEISKIYKTNGKQLEDIIKELKKENIPSINARIKKLNK